MVPGPHNANYAAADHLAELFLSCAHGGIKPHVQVHMNYPSINGMQGVRGSNPLSYTRHNASAGFPFRAVYQQITSSDC